jgi:hypothetical protein
VSANKCNFFYYCIRIYENKAVILATANNITTMTTREFMHNYWQRELQSLIEKRASAWKINRVKYQLSKYK